MQFDSPKTALEVFESLGYEMPEMSDGGRPDKEEDKREEGESLAERVARELRQLESAVEHPGKGFAMLPKLSAQGTHLGGRYEGAVELPKLTKHDLELMFRGNFGPGAKKRPEMGLSLSSEGSSIRGSYNPHSKSKSIEVSRPLMGGQVTAGASKSPYGAKEWKVAYEKNFDKGGAAFGNPNIQRQGAKARAAATANPSNLHAQATHLANRLARMATDPGGVAKEAAEQFMASHRELQDLMAQAYGDPKNPLKVTNPEAAEELNRRYFDIMTAFAPIGMTKGVGAKKGKADEALPLNLPRARPKTDAEIDALATRVARQMNEEHVRAPKKTSNLAGRSKKESDRLKAMEYELEPTGTAQPSTVYEAKKGDVNVALPGDQTVSDAILRRVGEIEGIDSVQQGGARYGLGKMDLDDPLFWASNEGPAQLFQTKVDRVADYFGPDRVVGQHLAMGPVSNNFAMHFADANLRAIDYSKMTPRQMNEFDKLIANGYIKKNQKTGEQEHITFGDWPGIANPEEALIAMRNNSELRKWFNNRMKTPDVTKPLNMPNGQDIQWAITEPLLRNMEVNLTGLSAGEMVPGAALTDTAAHGTYSKGIRGKALGHQEVLTPFTLSYADAAEHIASTQRPQDFTGTIQKVFPHQIVDDQYLNEIGRYRDLIKKYTGKKQGGLAQAYGDGGSLKATPVVNKPAHGMSKALSGLHQFASKPFGYNNPPGEMISEMLGIPATARTLERLGYGEPLTTGKGMTTKPRADTMEAMMAVAPLAPATKGLPVGAAIKHKGGNWTKGASGLDTADVGISRLMLTRGHTKSPKEMLEYEEYLDNARKTWAPEKQDQVDRMYREFEQMKANNAINEWVEKNLTGYLRNEMATPEDRVRLSIDRRAKEAKAKYMQANERADRMAKRAEAEPDPRRKANLQRQAATMLSEAQSNYRLAQENLMHIPAVEPYVPASLRKRRAEEGFPMEGLAESPAAQDWEAMADNSIRATRVGEIRNRAREDDASAPYSSGRSQQRDTAQQILENNPWMASASAQTRVYNPVVSSMEELGFNDIVNQLRMDIADGKLTPDQLKKVTVDQAVERLANRQLEDARTVQERALKQQEIFPVHKEYPEGYKWIELTKPKDALPEGFKILPDQTNYKNPGNELYTMFDDKGNAVSTGASEAEAMRLYKREEREKQLADALKYEGDTMGHCVGQYCEDVLQGRSRIFSLRNEKGEPHVTIEVEPAPNIGFRAGEGPATPEERFDLQSQWMKETESGKVPDTMTFATWWRQKNGIPEPERPVQISQIKGKQNAAPKEQYLPYVQDFVKGGQWSEVRDLENAGLYKADPEELGLFTPNDPRLRHLPGSRADDFRRAKEAGLFEDRDFLTRDEFEDILRRQIESESGPLPPIEE